MRRGVTLLEVLFAIGVVAVGLLGVMAILPVALHQVGRGNVADRALRLGQNSISQAEVELLHNTNTWVWRDPTLGTTSGPAFWSLPNTATPDTLRNYRSYAIDPLFLERRGFNVTLPPSGQYYDPAKFPYTMTTPAPTPPNPDNPRMERITLNSRFRDVSLPGPPPKLVPGTMTDIEANALFVLSDELVFDIPPEVSLSPTATYTQTKRESEGTFSWMATLTPSIDLLRATPSSNYLLSVVIFHRRNMGMPVDGLTEKVFPVTAFANGGYGGGDVTISGADEQDVQTGQWILLMGQIPTGIAVPDHVPLFKWYQVVATSGAPDAAATLDVSLQGADWPAAKTVNNQAGIIKNIVAIFEQTIVLQDE
jgi:type II secretory pathway pseudopilin PulG